MHLWIPEMVFAGVFFIIEIAVRKGLFLYVEK